MKNVFLLPFFAFFSLMAFAQNKNYLNISGKISNYDKDSIVIKNINQSYTKKFKVEKDGTFGDSMKVAPGPHVIIAAGQYDYLFLKNGFEIKVMLDAKDLSASSKYSGIGSENTNGWKDFFKLEEKLLDEEELSELDSLGLAEAFNKAEKKIDHFFNTSKNLDADALSWLVQYSGNNITQQKRYYFSATQLKRDLPTGSPSPEFNNYENYKGGTTSLKDLRGKYVYVDVWATWCGPCKAEIPNLKKLEESYKGKNIEFVSISVDDPRRTGGGSMDAVKVKWKAMIADKKMGGIQLLADNNWNSDFVKQYKINGIPRFILIDPDGKVV
ncbi:MAG: TlpA family protein disulfide reductase, partial [Saprospiraceae bacterium]